MGISVLISQLTLAFAKLAAFFYKKGAIMRHQVLLNIGADGEWMIIQPKLFDRYLHFKFTPPVNYTPSLQFLSYSKCVTESKRLPGGESFVRSWLIRF